MTATTGCSVRRTCRLCDSEHLVKFLALKPTPLANEFQSEHACAAVPTKFPLALHSCQDCGHIQLLTVVDPKRLFEQYLYVSGTSRRFRAHFQSYAATLCQQLRLSSKDLVVEIGSNDATLLQYFRDRGVQVLGIDPARTMVTQTSGLGIDTIVDFFNNDTAEFIASQYQRAKLVVANNVFAHVDNLAGMLQGISCILQSAGLFVFEVSYFLDVYRKNLFDTIYHEHLSYHTVKPLKCFLARHGFELIDVQAVDTHGGSIRCFAQLVNGPHTVHSRVEACIQEEKQAGLYCLEGLKKFQRNISAVKAQFMAILQPALARGAQIAGFGAPAKATTLMHQFGLDTNSLTYIVDDSPLKQGRLMPGSRIPIVAAKQLYTDPPDALVILAWNFADDIKRAHQQYQAQGGQFIIPLPYPYLA